MIFDLKIKNYRAKSALEVLRQLCGQIKKLEYKLKEFYGLEILDYTIYDAYIAKGNAVFSIKIYGY
jgi:hypothetical protein